MRAFCLSSTSMRRCPLGSKLFPSASKFFKSLIWGSANFSAFYVLEITLLLKMTRLFSSKAEALLELSEFAEVPIRSGRKAFATSVLNRESLGKIF